MSDKNKVLLLTEDEVNEIIRRTALAVADNLRKDLQRAQTRDRLNKAEVAEHLGCSTGTVNRYMREGMPFEKLDNGHPWFRRGEVDNWMRWRTNGGIQTLQRPENNGQRQELG